MSQIRCNEASPSWRKLHCQWNAMQQKVKIGFSEWQMYTGLYLFVKEREIIINTTPENCAAICLTYTWCKSFDYNHKYGDD